MNETDMLRKNIFYVITYTYIVYNMVCDIFLPNFYQKKFLI